MKYIKDKYYHILSETDNKAAALLVELVKAEALLKLANQLERFNDLFGSLTVPEAENSVRKMKVHLSGTVVGS